ncbi:MAG: choice-of-anchor J domain-containing protein [Candidatus Thermoplasmatota archaeon]|nr:choice-of-anchor J domain-containing protein [Candidatus Thermoplasmatota archaeon]
MIQKLVAVLAAALMLGTVFYSTVNASFSPPQLPGLGRDAAMRVTTSQTWADETRVLSENLIVENGGVLILQNVDLLMNSSYDNELVIRVEQWGRLHVLENSFIAAVNPAYHYRFEVYGELIIDQSDVRDTGSISADVGGIQIYTPSWGHVELSYCDIADSAGPGVYCEQTTPLIHYCSIRSNGGPGIAAVNCSGYDESTEDLSFELFLQQGWNFLSLPVEPADLSMSTIFSGVPYYQVYSWDAWNNTYQKIPLSEELQIGSGYLVFVLNDTWVNLTGDPLFDYSVELTQGWNMIGSLIYDTSLVIAETSPAGAVVNWSYAMDALGNFTETQEIRPGRGYWVLALQNTTLSLTCEKRNLGVEWNQIYENTGDGISLMSSNVSLRNNEIYKNSGTGVSLEETDCWFMDQNTMYDNEGAGLTCEASEILCTNSSWYNNTGPEVQASQDAEVSLLDCRCKTNDVDAADTSTVRCNKTFALRAVTWDEQNVSTATVQMYTNQGTEVFSGSTGSDGRIEPQILTYYTSTATGLQFFTPHTLVVENNTIQNRLNLVVDSPQDLTIYVGGDSDVDAIPDRLENKTYVYWMEAEAHVYNDQQIAGDLLASGSAAACNTPTTTEIINETVLAVPSGAYRLYVRARAEDASGTPTLRLSVSTDTSTLIANDDHFLTDQYHWYSTPTFTPLSNPIIGVSTVDSYDCIHIDRFMMAAEATAHGQITDPLQQDSDDDWLIDGLEVRNSTWWVEAEHYPAVSYAAQCINDVNASNAKALTCTGGSQETLSTTISLEADEYVYYVRARNLSGNTGTMQLKVDSTVLASFTAHEQYQWYAQNISIASAGTHVFTVQDTSAVRPAVCIDKIMVAKLADVLVATFTDGNASPTVVLPSGGGFNDTETVTLPEDAMVTTATVELIGNGTQQAFVSNAFSQSNPDVYEDVVVYEDNRNGDKDIYLYNFTSQTETQITALSGDQVNPAVHGQYIVWQDGQLVTTPPNLAVNPDFEIGPPDQWFFESGNPFFIPLYENSPVHSGMWAVGIQNIGSTSPAYAYWSQMQIPVIEGMEYEVSTWLNFIEKDPQSFHRAQIGVIWYDDMFVEIGQSWSPGVFDITGDWVHEEIMTIAPPTAMTAEVRLRLQCVSPGPAPYDITTVYFDDVVVQEGAASSDNWDIYLYDLSTSTMHQVTSEVSAQMNPDVSGQTVVWQDKRNGDWDIYRYDLSNGLPVQENLCVQVGTGNQPADQTYPSIDKNRLVWQDNRWGTWDVFLNVTAFSAEVYHVQETQLTWNLMNQQYPVISGDRVVWQDDRNANWDIYLYDLSAGYERQLTTNAFSQINPSISGDKVVWEDARHGNNDIYLFDCSSAKEKRLTWDASSQDHPAIYKDTVVWQDARNGVTSDLYGLNQYFTLDIGDDSLVEWTHPAVFVEPDVSRNLADEINMYLAEHFTDRSRGSISVPFTVYSNQAGNLTLLNLSVSMEYLTDPLDADTDGDGLREGREIYGFFGADIIEAEDAVAIQEWRHPYADYVDPLRGDPSNGGKVFLFDEVNFIHQTGVTLTSSYNYTEAFEGARDSWITLKTHIDDTGVYKLIVNPVLEEKENLGITVDDTPQIAYKYVSEYAYVPVVVDEEGEDILLNETLAMYLRKVIENATYVTVEKTNGDEILPRNMQEKERVALSEIAFGTKLSGVQTTNISLKANWRSEAEYNFTRNTEYTITIGIDLELLPPELLPPGGAEVPTNRPWDSVSLARILDVDCIRVERQTLDPLSIDADNDTLLDGLEATDSYYPLNPDADGDGLNDAIELYETFTTLGYRDSDYDGLRDAVELGWTSQTISATGGEVSSAGSWRERIAHHDSAYNYTAINNYDADANTTTDPFNPDSDADGIPDGWCDGWVYQPNPVNPTGVKSYQKNANMFKDVNYWRYDKNFWVFGGVMDCLVQIWEGEDLNLNGARGTNMSSWGFDAVTYERLDTTSGETEPADEDSDDDQLPEGYEVWYSHVEPCVLSDAGTPLIPTDDIYFLDPTNDDARFDFDVDATGTELFNQSTGGSWLTLDGAGVHALAQKILLNTPVLYNISRISVHLDTQGASKARLEIWSLWNGAPFARMTTVDNYDVSGDGWCVFDVPDAVFRTANLFGQPLNGFFIVMRWTTADYDWKVQLGAGAPGDTWVQDNSGTWVQTNDLFDHILYAEVYTGDNLTNLEEYIVGTNPKNRNTDKTMAWGADDQLSDGEEVGYQYVGAGSVTSAQQGFEQGLVPPHGWVGYSNNQGTTWEPSLSFAFEGTYAAVCDPGDFSEEKDEWLISESIYIGEEDVMALEFMHSSTFAPESDVKSILISTSGVEKNDFVLLESIPPLSMPEVWEPMIIDLSAYAGMTIHLAWRYEKLGGMPGQDWYIDNVLVSGSTTIPENRGGVIFRTNVSEGALRFDTYGGSEDWIAFDGDGESTLIAGRNYSYQQTLVDPTVASAKVSEDNILLFTLQDRTRIYHNQTTDELLVWSPDAHLRDTQTRYVGSISEQYYTGTCHVYSYNGAVDMSAYGPSLAYRNQELYLSSPFTPDTDGDFIPDGCEISWNQNAERNANGNLIEADRLINVRDSDSDDDHAPDGYEIDWQSDTDSDGQENMVDHDADADGIKDGDELDWNNDVDGDGLINMEDQDADNDGLLDGWDDTNGNLQKDAGEAAGEDTNANGIHDDSETSAIKYDSDEDGLWDGYDINVVTGHSWLLGQHLGELTVHSFTGQTSATDNMDWDSDDDTLSDGQEVLGWTIRIHTYTGADTLVQVYSNPTAQHSDPDALRDDVEYRFSNASTSDTDSDGLADHIEDANHDGVTQTTETSPVSADTDDDGLIDGNINNANYPAEDRDNDGVLDDNEPNPLKEDSDEDGIIDSVEYWSLKNHTVANGYGYYDSDSDGLIDLREYDSDNDGLSDGEENFNHDDEINTTTEADPTDYDTDDDELLDGAEPDWKIDSDNDGSINVRDGNSNDPSWVLGDDDYDNVYVVFRTNAVDLDGDGYLNYKIGTWITVDPTGANLMSPSTLELKRYSWVAGGIPSINGKPIETSYGPGNKNPIAVVTPDGYEVFVDTSSQSTIYLKIESSYMKYQQSWFGDTSVHPIPKTSPSSPNYIANHQETYDGRPAVSDDFDFDDLSNTIELTYGTAMDDADSDDDGVMDGKELLWCLDSDTDGRINALDNDSDADGLFDATEMGVTSPIPAYDSIIKGTDVTKGNYTADADPTTLTDPLLADTDADGLSDGAEDTDKNGAVAVGSETNPLDKDTDDDGITDGAEVNGFSVTGFGVITTNPLNHDTDGDTIFDATESGYTNSMISGDTDLTKNHFIADVDPASRTNASDDDTDDDGLLDGNEDVNKNGRREDTELDPNDEDSDGDLLTDGLESGLTTPQGSDTNTASPHWQPDSDPTSTTNPQEPDSDGDTIPDGTEDRDKDGLRDGDDPTNSVSDWNNGAGPGETDPTDPDTDGDLVYDQLEIDGWDVEVFWESNMTIKETRHVCSDPLKPDTDDDGVSDYYEYGNKTDSTIDDTDGDGIDDLTEALAGTNMRGIEANQPWLTRAEIDVRIDYVQTLVKVVSWIPLVGDIVEWIVKDVPSGLYITCWIEADDDVGVESIWVKVDGESPQQQYGFDFRYEFEVDYDLYFLKGWNIDVKATDVNGNIGKPDYPLHIDGLADKLYNLLVMGLVLVLLGLGFDPAKLNALPDNDHDGLSDVLELACLLNPRVKDVLWVDLTVAFNWDVTNDIWDLWYLNAYHQGMQLASNFFFDGTDGHFIFDTITFYDEVSDGDAEWDDADIQVWEGLNAQWPSSDGGGDRSGGINRAGDSIWLPQFFDQWGLGWLSAVRPNHADYYKTIAHESGHYILHLYDEYEDAEGDSYPGFIDNLGPKSIMNVQHVYDEFTCPITYDILWTPPWGYSDTEQHASPTHKSGKINPNAGESCWDSIFRYYFTEPRTDPGAVAGRDYIYFDLEHDGVPDYTMYRWYIPNPGPHVNVGRFMTFHDHV